VQIGSAGATRAARHPPGMEVNAVRFVTGVAGEARCNISPVDVPEIMGYDVLVDKRSAVDAQARWRIDPIDGLVFRPVRPVPHEDGTVAEVARASWPEIDLPIVQVHVTTTQPGRIRAWGLHRRSTDRLFVVNGLVSIVVYDGRRDSPTCGALNEFKISERNPGLVVIAPNLYHGWKNIGTTEAFIINMPSSQYDYDEPDALDLPYDLPEAPEIVPFRW
jgi:dTDP-4-dehydrorhamnose 3,5-epimerase